MHVYTAIAWLVCVIQSGTHLSLLCLTIPGWWWLVAFDPCSMPFGAGGICLISGIFTAHAGMCVLLI